MDLLSLPGMQRTDLPQEPIRALGIDLGTTNSTVAEVVWDPMDPGSTVARCLEVAQPTMEGRYVHVMVPSMVALYGEKTLVGEGAKRLRAKSPELKLEQYAAGSRGLRLAGSQG